jgi:sulfoacetaldehyde acetyltransferase
MDHLSAALEDMPSKLPDEAKTSTTTFIECVLNQELGEPFRRDAMKKPVSVAGIDPSDMRPQTGAL